MKRLRAIPRPNWQATVESQGLHFHTPEGQPYWDESAYYQFTAREIDELEAATYELDRMCLAAAQHVVDERRCDLLGIPEAFADWVAKSWEGDDLTIYGRFDLAYDGQGPPKLLEYNADTPTSLLEAAVIQWHWMKDTQPQFDQFNNIHERLIEAWTALKPAARGTVYFSSLKGHVEDYMTANYLRDTAIQADLATEYLAIDDIGWNERRRLFVDLRERPIQQIFKLYPWEWLIHESFGPNLIRCPTRWLESPWKMMLSNKAILIVLHELFPDSPYLLPTTLQPIGDSYVKKPTLAREGANITMVANGQAVLETGGDYGGPFVYQELHRLPEFDGNYPVIGSWMVNGYACGIGIREDTSPVTQNLSRFVPHVFSS
ncbi:MAG TPA: glutathionylspermidine synthase family protein [Tepidisphaeraceae bacterium]|nr:glutathionylspermidine synthase family protein [Tepidisphaeraceae bacterium]